MRAHFSCTAGAVCGDMTLHTYIHFSPSLSDLPLSLYLALYLSQTAAPASRNPPKKSLLDAGTKLRTTGFLGMPRPDTQGAGRPHTTQRGG